MEVNSPFASAITESEWRHVPSAIAQKLTTFVTAKFEEFITTKAILETNKYNAEQSLTEFRDKYDLVSGEKEELVEKLEASSKTITELESQLSSAVAEVTKLQLTLNSLETETNDFRMQRNQAIDERDELSKMIERRNSELERMQGDLTVLTKQLEAAVSAKCEALAQADEVATMKITIEYKEKRMEQERELLNSQVESLTADLNQRVEELANIRRENTYRCIQLETKLSEKVQELQVQKDQVKALSETNESLKEKMEELTEKLVNQQDLHAKTNESYMHELEAQSKLADLYKKTSEEQQEHVEKLTKALEELQTNLNTACEHYGDLETKHKEETLRFEEIIAKKNETIAVLKKELETANELLENSKKDQIQREIENLSPTAASTSRVIKSGMTMTEIYSQYMTALEELAQQKEETARLQSYINHIVAEIEEKGPLLKKQREDYEVALENVTDLTKRNDELVMEIQQLMEINNDLKRSEGTTSRENARLKKELADLGRQVCHLLREVEHSRTGSSSTSVDQDTNDSVCSADIITKRLVTFNDIAELQSNNQRLLAIVRELTSRQEEIESMDPAAISKLQSQVETLRAAQSESLEQQERQTKLINTIISQRDLYKNLYKKQLMRKGSGDDVSFEDKDGSQLEDGMEVGNGDNDENKVRIKELQKEVEKYQKELDFVKSENETYRKEKTANEKILLEQLEKIRNESKNLTRDNIKLAAKVESNEEKFKIFQNNMEIYKQQISALERQNKINSETVVKQEQTIIYLKDELLRTQSKLSKAEVMLGNLQKENCLLRDSEQRLLKERELNKRDEHTQNLLQTNIELIKATLERNDAENRIRLESRLDEAHRECAALRRRLQEEQDEFRKLTAHLEKKTETAKERMEEEKQQADRLRTELCEVREELARKSQQIEELSKKLKMTMVVTGEGVEVRKYRELEKMLSDSQAEVETLKSKLNAAKEAVEQHANVADAAEKQVKEMIEANQENQKKFAEQEQTLAQLRERCSNLEAELSVQNDGEESTNTGLKTRIFKLEQELQNEKENLLETKKELEASKVEVNGLRAELEESQKNYTREMMLHVAAMKAMNDMNEQLNNVRERMYEFKHARDHALVTLQESRASWATQESMYEKDRLEMEERLKNIQTQNSLLLDQIQELNNQLTIIQTQGTSSANTSFADASMNRSFTEDEVKSSDQLLKIIKYLRQEKDIAVSKCEIHEAEQLRLKTQLELSQRQLEEAKAALEAQQQNSEIAVVTAAKHAEVLRKVETLNAITDSNRALRQERDALLKELAEVRDKLVKVENELAPLQEANRELTIKAEAMQTENVSIRGEATRWRQRANFLIEKSNRTSPEDWKKLQNERETLAKQLTVERGNVAKLTDENNNLKQEKGKLEEQVKQLRAQNLSLNEEVARLNDGLQKLQAQVSSLSQKVEEFKEKEKKMLEENRLLTEDTAAKDVMITDLKNNLTQIRKIAKKYKTQFEDQIKEIEALKQQNAENSERLTTEQQEQLRQEGRQEVESRISQIEQTHKEKVDELNQLVASSSEENETFKKEVESIRQISIEKEERFKTLFKSAKDRIVQLTEQNNTLREELNNQDRPRRSTDTQPSSEAANAELLAEIENMRKENERMLNELQEQKERYTNEIESLTQRVNQLQRQLGHQQGSKPSTSSASSEKTATEPPTANIKPMAGHSNSQTQSVPIQPWRSGGEPPLASIRPMSMQVRTVAVLPTSQQQQQQQQPSTAVMVPPQQQVHTTGSAGGSGTDALSSSPTSSHTDYVPATSTANLSMLGPRQIAVPPTQSSQDAEDEDINMQVQQAPQQQAVALVLPRVEPPSVGPTQEQGTSSSSSSSNTVTTSQGSHKRPRDADTDSSCQMEEQGKNQQQPKRIRIQGQGGVEAFQSVSESGLEVEYQVPTSSQRDHEEDTDTVIVVESDEEGDGPDEGEGADDEPDEADAEGYELEVEQQLNYEDADCQDVEEIEEGGNEVEVIEDSSEVPNQSEHSRQESQVEMEQPQSEATSSGTDGSTGVTISQASTSVSATISSFSRTRPVIPLSRQQQQTHLMLPHGLEDGGDDGIVPSTPTLFVPRRSDGFGEAVSSPHVPTSGRFTFGESSSSSGQVTGAEGNEVVPEQTLEMGNMDDNSTGRSVPSTPLQASPQESGPNVEDHGGHQTTQSDVEMASISASGSTDEPEPAPEGSSSTSGECMGPPPVAGTSGEATAAASQEQQVEEMLEGEDGVSSEGEKAVTTEEGGEEEGREAEASPSTNTRSRSQVGGRGQQAARRSVRVSHMRAGGGNVSRPSPTPIVWNEQRTLRHVQTQQQPQQESPDFRGVGRGASGSHHGNYGARGARRSRGRALRPYGRF